MMNYLESSSEELEALNELRQLLFGEQKTEIVELQKRLDDPEIHAADVGQALPEAIVLRSQQDDRLAEALGPLVEGALQRTIKNNLGALAEALYPVIGPAIRRAIASALQGLVQSMNQAIDHTFTVRGLKWRVEAWRSGCSVGEIALRHSLVYRVEQVFLIHRETGLPLLHVGQDEGNEALVAGMLTAIQDFVRDSLNAQEGEELEVVQVGDLTLWIESGPRAVLAAVVRGTAPATLREQLQRVNERIHKWQSEDLAQFTGDPEPFAGSRALLESCLAERHRETKGAKKAIAVLVLLALGLLTLGGYLLVERHRRQELVLALRQTQGIVVVSAGSEKGEFVVRGLRDPLAPDPTALVASAGLEPGEVRLALARFHSFEPPLVLARARKLLKPPSSVKLALRSGQLEASGVASKAWIERTRILAVTLPGVDQFVDDHLRVEVDQLIETRRAAVEKVELVYLPGSEATLKQPERLTELTEALLKLVRVRPDTHLIVRLGRGGEALHKARWTALRKHFEEAGVPSAVLDRAKQVDAGNPDVCRLRVISRGE